MSHGWPLSGIRDDGSAKAFSEIGSLAGLSEEKLQLVREAWIAKAYAMLPDLTPEEKRLAQDKALSRECSYWRVQFREMEKARDSFQRRAEQAEAALSRMDERLGTMLAGINGNDSAESPAALASTG